MTTSPLEEMRRCVEQERARPLGMVREQSNRTMAPVSRGLRKACDNLLGKAGRAIYEGEEDRARRYVGRAVDLPFDEHEQVAPAWWAVEMMLFNAISDRLEVCSEDDDSWLTAAEQIMPRCDEAAAVALRASLAAIVEDRTLSDGEGARCRHLVGQATTEDWRRREPADRQEQVDDVLSVVRATVDYWRHPLDEQG